MAQSDRPRDTGAIVILGAVLPLIEQIVQDLAGRGSVVVIDRDEDRLMTLSRQVTLSIETLCLDLRKDSARRRLVEAWEDYPISLLIDLQALRDPAQPWDALRLVPVMVADFRDALLLAGGSVVVAVEDRPYDLSGLHGASHAGLVQLPVALHQEFSRSGHDIRINGLRCAQGAQPGDFADVVALLAESRGIRGTVLSLAAASD